MSVVEIERGDGVMVIRMNRPERLNALGTELRAGLKQAPGAAFTFTLEEGSRALPK